jgi:hypothetical protein
MISLSTKRQPTNFRLYNEQIENGLRKIAWPSVFCFLFETGAQINIYVNAGVSIYIYIQKNSICFLQMENSKLSLVSCKWKWKTKVFSWSANDNGD